MDIRIITSTKNSIIVQTKKLKQKKYREQTHTFFAEGLKNVNDTLKLANAKMIFTLSEKTVSSECNCPVYIVNEQIMKEISDTVTPQGIAGVFEMKDFEENRLSEKMLILNGVGDPGNVGTILRTACALGFSTVIVDAKTADIYSPKVVRSAMSSIYCLNILRCEFLYDAIKKYKGEGYKLYVSSLSENSKDIGKIAFSKKCMIVVGNEANGVEDEVLKAADETYIIPMKGNIESLNVSVAAAISMFEANN